MWSRAGFLGGKVRYNKAMNRAVMLKEVTVKKAFFVLSLLFASSVCAFTVAIVPQFTPTVTEKMWSPVIKELSQASGAPLTLKYYKNIAEFEKGLSRGEVDFAYMNPYHVVMFKKNYKPLIKDGKQKLRGILVVPDDGKYKNVKELNGKKIAFPSPNAFAASLLVRAQLKYVEKIDFEPVYVNTHTNVYKYVLIGDSDAGGGVNKTLKKESLEIQSKLRTLYATPEVSPHPFCANKKLSDSVSKKVEEAFLKLTSSGQAVGKALEEIEISQPARADYKTDYEYLEKLNISKLVVAE